MSITKSPIFDGMEFVNRDSVSNEVLTDSTIPIVVQDGKLKIDGVLVGGMIPTLEEPNVPTQPTGDNISLYYDSTDNVLKGLTSTSTQLTFAYESGVGDFTGSGSDGEIAYWGASTNLSTIPNFTYDAGDEILNIDCKSNLSQVQNIIITNGDTTHGLKSSNGICIGTDTGITPSSIKNEITIQQKVDPDLSPCIMGLTADGIPSNIVVTKLYMQSDNVNGFGLLYVLSDGVLKYGNNITATSKNVILGTSDGAATRIPFFDTKNSLTSSEYLIFDGTKLKVNNTDVGDISGSLTYGRIPVASGGKTLSDYAGFTYSGGTLSVTGNGIQTNKLRLKDLTGGSPYQDIINDWTASNVIKITSFYGGISYIVKMFSDTSNSISIGSNTKLGIDSVNVGVGNIITSGGDAVFNNGVILGNGNKITPIETNCDNSIILGNDTICHRSNEIVTTIDKTVVSKTVGESITTYNANQSVKGERSFYIDILTTDDVKTEVIFKAFNTSVVLFEVKMNIFQILSGVFSSVIFKGAVSVRNGGIISFLKPHNDTNSYTLDSNSLNYTTETFSSEVVAIPVELSLFGTNNIILSYDNSNGDAVRIDGVISYVESRY